MIRRLGWFLVGVFLSVVWGFSYAETIPATPSPCGNGDVFKSGGVQSCTANGLCMALANPSAFMSIADGVIRCLDVNTYQPVTFPASQVPAGPSCPDASWTLSGETCTRVDCAAKAGHIESDTFLDSGANKAGDTISIDGCKATVIYRDSYSNCVFPAGGVGLCQKLVDVEYKFDGANTSDATPEKADKPMDADRCRAAGDNVVVGSSGAVTCTAPTPSNPTTKEGFQEKKTRNPDNSTTNEEKRVSEKCTGASCERTVSTTVGGTNADGTPKTPSTTTTTTGGNGKGDGEDAGAFCTENPTNVLCKKQKAKETGKYGSRDSDIENAKNNLRSEFNNIKTQLNAMFSNLGAGGGSLPCPPGVTVLGKTITICADPYENKLGGIGAALVFMAAAMSAFIILKR